MNTSDPWLVVAIGVLGLLTIGGILFTKTPGFGRFSTSVLLLAVVVFVSALLLIAGKIEGYIFANIAFAVAGFSGGLINGKKE